MKVPIPVYYDHYIIPLDRKRFFRGGLTINSMTICPLHKDSDPSFGLMKDKFNPKIMLYHCFGCGSVGDLVRLHQRIEYQYHNRDLSENETILDLAKIFPEIDLSEVVLIDESESFASFRRGLVAIEQSQSRYTLRDYQEDLKVVRRKQFHADPSEVARAVQSATLKYLVTEKDLLY
jgi:hypothetical protein